MEDLKLTIEKMVEVILRSDSKTRSCDNLLYIRYLDELGREKGVNYLQMTVLQFFAHMSELGVSPIESIGRYRRKLQRKYPELKANAEVTAFRAEREEQFRAYARS